MTLRDHLLAIKQKRGELTPQAVVDEARDPRHALHHRFEWDDSVAGELYRREQARQLIVEVKVVYKSDNGSSKSIRGFYAIQDGSEGNFAYHDVNELRADPVTREIILRNMERDWRAMQDRYEDFEEFWSLVQEKVSAHV